MKQTRRRITQHWKSVGEQADKDAAHSLPHHSTLEKRWGTRKQARTHTLGVWMLRLSAWSRGIVRAKGVSVLTAWRASKRRRRSVCVWGLFLPP